MDTSEKTQNFRNQYYPSARQHFHLSKHITKEISKSRSYAACLIEAHFCEPLLT
ncbi:hypothetical protein BABINDRAFT_43144 [Babjeviella inositovora NRRL Y-12698]|uniref:Uncharacterized protein n=1 Tax=Babjeviella inositovora NRRL Y-12698 TaxID=984486 RepID=A0A1E3QXL4_9ASCO|nr:uncharacterized protein BABINDRAFT_43144 [Babjeviella inositovora NRRL Y-12698]ODQ82403.1 hypothetical protein BABINDRAFT_43144 [Babjeviella inositovora NRRL Y-12698]